MPSPCTRTSKNHAGRRSGAPLTIFSRWCALAISMAGAPDSAADEVAEHLAIAHELPREDRRDLVTPGHDLHCHGTGRQNVTDVVEALRPDQPGLVGEHVEACVVKPSHQRDLPVVAAGEDDDVARPIGEQAIERPVARTHHRPPGRRPLRATVERVDQREEIVQLRAGRRVDVDLVAHAGMTLPQRERGVEVARVEEGEGVHWRHYRRSIPRGVSCR